MKKFKERNNKKRGIIIFTFICGCLVTTAVFLTTYAYYEEQKELEVVNGKVEYPGDLYFAYYVDGSITDTMPSQNTGYTLDETNSCCTNGVTIEWDASAWEARANYTNYEQEAGTTRTKCTLYFEKTSYTVSTVLRDIEVNSYTPDFSQTSCSSGCDNTESGIFAIEDDDGTSYYYRGSVENNYVYFAGFYWRIIRINGDGSLRLIYDGTTAHANGDASEDRYIDTGTSKFNVAYTDNMYVGYMYTSGEAHGTGSSSTIKEVVDTWFSTYLTSYTSYLDYNAGFCGDRSTLNLGNGVGTGTTVTYYSAYLRVVESNSSLSCSNSSDLYTTSSSTKGNKALTYPIALITVDEYMLAGNGGGVFNGDQIHTPTNYSSYLYIGNVYWTMTPVGYYNAFGFADSGAGVFAGGVDGNLGDYRPAYARAVRPVINIRSNVTITGSGTALDPYCITGA